MPNPSSQNRILEALGQDAVTAAAVRDLARRLGYDVRRVKRVLEGQGYVETYLPPPQTGKGTGTGTGTGTGAGIGTGTDIKKALSEAPSE